eukprot:958284_1
MELTNPTDIQLQIDVLQSQDETKQNGNRNSENENEDSANETSQLSPKDSPKVPQSPKTPAPKPPSFPNIDNIDINAAIDEPKTPPLHRRETPKAIAPRPPSYDPKTTSKTQLIHINENDPLRKPPFHDYTSMACCLILFFFFTIFSIVSYWKAKGAIEAYRKEEFVRYRKLNRQARSYMIISVGSAMAVIVIALLLIIFTTDKTPDDTVPEP